MSDVSISYKGAEIGSLDDSGTKRLLTSGKYCEDDIEVTYTKPSGGGGDEYGLVDVIYDQGDITGAVQNNKLVNLTITTVSTKKRFMLKKPIHVVAGDVISFEIIRTSATNPGASGGYNDFYLDLSPALELAKTNTALKDNVPVVLTHTRPSDGTPFDVVAIRMGGRNGTYWTNLNADIHMYLNGTQLF